jgi:hypothetical protein
VEEERKAKSIHEVCEENDLRKYIPASFKKKMRARGGANGGV